MAPDVALGAVLGTVPGAVLKTATEEVGTAVETATEE